MRENPQFENASEVAADPQRAQDFLKDLSGAVDDDDADRFSWMENKAHFQKRRYGKYDRTPEFPWPGSSNVVMPLIDKTIDTLKPSYINLITSAKPPVTTYGADKESMKNEANVELWFEWMIKWGSPRFIEEIIYATDECLEIGRGILKTYWSWQTAPIPETLVRERLPKRLRNLVVTSKTAEEADNLAAVMQEAGMQPAVLTVDEFDERREFIKKVVVNEFHLDEDQGIDREAAKRIMSWLRAGAKNPLTVTKRDVYVDAPAISCVSALDLIVPTYTNDVQESERICHRMFFSESMILQRAANTSWNKNAVKMLIDERKRGKTKNMRRGNSLSGSSSVTYKDDQRDMAGITRVDIGEEYEVNEVCAWYSDGVGKSDRKVVVTYSPDMPKHPLKFVVYQRPSYKWPYHSFPFEMNKKGWYTPRGIPELLDDLEAEITWQHRQKLNRMAIANSPTFMYRINSKINPNTWRWMPGRFFPVQNVQTDVAPIQVPNVQMSEEREEQILRTWAQDRVGSPDSGIASDLSSLTEPRTATEIRQIQGLSKSALSMRGQLFQRCMQEVYHEFFDLWIEYGPHETWIRLTGSEPLKLTKEELQGKFVFQATGTIGETDPAMEAMKAQARLATLFQVQQTGAIGDEYEIDLAAAIIDWLEKDDVRFARKVVRARTPQEIQQIQQERQRKAKMVEAANANVPMNLPDLREAVNEVKSQAPHKGAQQLDMRGTIQKAMSNVNR